MTSELAELDQMRAMADDEAPDAVPVPHALVPHLGETAILLDIDGTLLDLMPTPREVWVPPGLSETLKALVECTSGALALVSGRSLNDIDLIFAPDVFRAVAGHGAEMRLSVDSEADDVHAPPLDKELKRRLAAIAKLSPGILLEDKGYSLALHYRLAPHAEKAIYESVSLRCGTRACGTGTESGISSSSMVRMSITSELIAYSIKASGRAICSSDLRSAATA